MAHTAKELIELIKNGELNDRLKDLYVDDNLICAQQERYVAALKKFIDLYGDNYVEIFSAPGRSEVGGNHTDHQRGMVLATAVNMDIIGVVAKNEKAYVSLHSEGYGETRISIEDLSPIADEIGTTAALIRGVMDQLQKQGYQVGGFNGYVTSQVPEGAGLSSSAAFEVLVGRIISGLYNNDAVDPVTIAKIGQRSENEYFGKPCGLMDQMASSVGGLIFIDFKDKQNPIVEKLDIDFDSFKHSLCIVDTKGSHANLTDEYAAIPGEMGAVAGFFGKDVLREIDWDEFLKFIPVIRTKAGDRAVLRTIHWFGEENKVVAQVEALKNKDFEGFKKLIKASGESSYKYLQNAYSVKDSTRQEICIGLALSEEILGDSGVCRVHGGGFAGTIQAFVADDKVAEYKERMELVFGKGACHVLKVRPFGGERVV